MLLTNSFSPALLTRKIKYLLVILLCILTQGCTVILWKSAISKDVYLHGDIGIALTKKGDEDTSRNLYVTYTGKYKLSNIPPYTYVIPLEGENIPELFDYRGSQRSLQGIIADLPKEKLNRIQNYKLPLKSYGYGIDFSGESIHWKNVFGSVLYDDRRREDFSVNGVTVYPYTLRVQDTDDQEYKKVNYFKPPVNPHYTYLILPEKQHRATSERLFDIIITTMGTPFSLAADICIFVSNGLNPAYISEAFHGRRE